MSQSSTWIWRYPSSEGMDSFQGPVSDALKTGEADIRW